MDVDGVRDAQTEVELTTVPQGSVKAPSEATSRKEAIDATDAVKLPFQHLDTLKIPGKFNTSARRDAIDKFVQSFQNEDMTALHLAATIQTLQELVHLECLSPREKFRIYSAFSTRVLDHAIQYRMEEEDFQSLRSSGVKNTLLNDLYTTEDTHEYMRKLVKDMRSVLLEDHKTYMHTVGARVGGAHDDLWEALKKWLKFKMGFMKEQYGNISSADYHEDARDISDVARRLESLANGGNETTGARTNFWQGRGNPHGPQPLADYPESTSGRQAV